MLALLFVVSYRHVYFPAPPRGCFFPSGYCSLYFILFFLAHSNVRCKGYISLASHTLCDVSSGLQPRRLYLEATHSPTFAPDAISPSAYFRSNCCRPSPTVFQPQAATNWLELLRGSDGCTCKPCAQRSGPGTTLVFFFFPGARSKLLSRFRVRVWIVTAHACTSLISDDGLSCSFSWPFSALVFYICTIVFHYTDHLYFFAKYSTNGSCASDQSCTCEPQ